MARESVFLPCLELGMLPREIDILVILHVCWQERDKITASALVKLDATSVQDADQRALHEGRFLFRDCLEGDLPVSFINDVHVNRLEMFS